MKVIHTYPQKRQLENLMKEHINVELDGEGQSTNMCYYVDSEHDDNKFAVFATNKLGFQVNPWHVRSMRQDVFGNLKSSRSVEEIREAIDRQTLSDLVTRVDNLEKLLDYLTKKSDTKPNKDDSVKRHNHVFEVGRQL